MSRYYSIDEANAAVPEAERILIALRDQREELIARRDKVVELSPADDTTLVAGVPEPRPVPLGRSVNGRRESKP